MVAQIVNKNQSGFASFSNQLPPQNIEAEEAILGGILLDPEALERIITVLEPSDFSLKNHQIIYHACVALKAQDKPTDLMTVTTYLSDKGLLESVGGQLKLSQLVEQTVSAVNIDQYTNLILEKRLRRQLIEYGNNVINGSFTINPDEGVGGLLEQMESSFFEIASRFRRGSFVRASTAKFQAISRELERIEDNCDNNEALKQWELQELAKKYGFKSRREMLNFHVLWLGSRSKNQFMGLKEYLEKYGDASEHWLLRGWIPKQTITLLHAKGGKGKTRLVGHLCRVVINGGQWGDYYADKPGYVLFIETDQGDRVTAEQLKEQGYLDDSPEAQERFSILSDWKIEQFGILRSKIAEIKEKDPKANILIMIDSLSSTSTQSLYSENDQEYARPLMRLRDIAEKNDATFLVIHHSSSQGTARGSTAIYNSVDQVWKLESVGDDPRDCKRILTIEKTRSREPGRYQLEYDPNTWGWNIKGMLLDVEGEEQIENYSQRELSLIKFFRENAGTPFEVQDLAETLGFAADPLRRDLGFLSRRGLISKQQKPNSRANWYFVGELKLTDRTDRPIAQEKSENPKTKFFQNSAIASIGSPKLPPEASQEPIANLRSVRSDRSVPVFSETPTEYALQPKNDEKDVLQNIPASLGIVKETLQNTPQPIVKPGQKQEPIDVRSVDFDKLKEGDVLFDNAGIPYQLVELSRQIWLTHRKDEFISRNDLQIGNFHHATVEDIAGLMQLIIKSKDLKQFDWLSKIYGDSSNSLMSRSVVAFPELAEIYKIEVCE
ncbi:putative replicative DNA helicase [Planktothrix agardhii NIES-204]|nr:putative replicative DNA helicase [Planktothrix agardhii NIES-204]